MSESKENADKKVSASLGTTIGNDGKVVVETSVIVKPPAKLAAATQAASDTAVLARKTAEDAATTAKATAQTLANQGQALANQGKDAVDKGLAQGKDALQQSKAEALMRAKKVGGGFFSVFKSKVSSIFGSSVADVAENLVTDLAAGKKPMEVAKAAAMQAASAAAAQAGISPDSVAALTNAASDVISGKKSILEVSQAVVAQISKEGASTFLKKFGIDIKEDTLKEVVGLMSNFDPKKVITFGYKQIEDNADVKSAFESLKTTVAPFLNAQGALEPKAFQELGNNLSQVLNQTLKESVMDSLKAKLDPAEFEKLKQSTNNLIECVSQGKDTVGFQVMGVMKSLIKTVPGGTQFLPVIQEMAGEDPKKAMASAMKFTVQSAASYLSAIGTPNVTIELPENCDINALKKDKQALDGMVEKFDMLVKEARAAGLKPVLSPEAVNLGIQISADPTKGIEVRAEAQQVPTLKSSH